MTTTDPPQKLPRALPGRARGAALFLGAFAIAACVLWAVRPPGRDARLEIDEPEWLTMSIHDALQITEGLSPFARIPPSPYQRADGDPWEVGIHQSTFGFMNPMLPKLVFGSVCLALGHRDFDPAVYPRFAKELPPERAALANEKVQAAAPPIRVLMLVLAALCAALLFQVGRELAGTLAGVATFALFLASPNVVDHATRIRTDLFPIAFGLVGLAVALRSVSACRRCTGARPLGTAVVLGVLAGLSVGSKLNGALVAILSGLWITVAWLAERRAGGVSFARGPLVRWIAAGALCTSLFFLFEPHLWTDPIGGLRELSESWRGDLAYQKDLFGERLGRADTLREHLALALRGLSGEYEPLFALTGVALGAPLLLAGLAWLAWHSRGRPVNARTSRDLGSDERTPHPRPSADSIPLDPSSRADAARMVLAYVLVLGIGTALWLPFGRDNFFLAFAPLVALLEGLALGALGLFLRRRVGARTP